MKPDALKYFVCPSCHGELRLHGSESTEIKTGHLDCRTCGSRYPIQRGIPRFVVGENYTDTFGRQWTRWARTQHDSLNGTHIFRDRMFRYAGWTPESMKGKVVVDAGCGPGGFIDVIEQVAKTVIGFDLSAAIDSAYELHGHRKNVYLAQADIFHPPVRPGIADRLYTFGVVQHTPQPEQAFRALVPLIKEGGEISVWVYRKHIVPAPSYFLRLLTRGMPEPTATHFIEWYVPKALRVSHVLASIPKVGHLLRRLVPVADYRGRLPLDEATQREWSLMDTHDALITRYTYPQRWTDLTRWMTGLENVHRPSPHEMSAVGVKPSPRLGQKI